MTEFPDGCEGWDCRYYGTARINGEDKDCCLATGEVVLINDLEHCLLQECEEEQKEITNEEIRRYGELLQECEAALGKINLAVSKLTASFDREDLEALIYGKTNPYRPPEPEWVKSLIQQARDIGAAVFLKDNLRWPEKIQEFPLPEVDTL